MILAVVFWALMIGLAYLYGSAALIGLRRLLRFGEIEACELPDVLLVGVIVLSVLAMIANLFIPLSGLYVVNLLVGGVIIAFNPNLRVAIKFYLKHPLIWLAAALVFLLVLENGTHVPSNPDTGLYHAQTIRWFETYRIVPGLGNIQERYAFNSSWLVLNASLSFAFLGLRSFRLVGGLLFLIVLLYFIDGMSDLIQKKLTASSLMKVLFLPLGFYLLGSEISSVGTDMPVTLLIWIIVTLWIESIEFPQRSNNNILLVFLLSVFSLTLKLSSAPILLFVLLIAYPYLVKREWRRILIFGVAGSLLVIPWLIRSVILSGYLVFPVGSIDLFPVDWKIPQTQVTVIVNGVVGFARLPGLSFLDAVGVPVTQWFPNWWMRATLNQRAIYGFVLLSPAVIILARWIYPTLVSSKYLFAYGITFIGSIFWFLSAPNIRFGYGFLIATCVLTAIPFLMGILPFIDHDVRIIPSSALLILIVFHAFILWHSIDVPTLSQRWLMPADYHSAGVEPCSIRNATIYCRKPDAQCQYSVFPCIPFLRPSVEMRGASYQDGFRYPPDYGK